VNLNSIRNALAGRGLAVANMIPDAGGGRVEKPTIQPARLVEGACLESIAVRPGSAPPQPIAFLDGIQRSEVVAYAGASPIVVAEIAAAARERRERRLHTVLEDRRRVVLARPDALLAAGETLAAFEPVPLDNDEAPHPIRDLVHAIRALDQRRRALVLDVGHRYRAQSQGWLVVDGALSESPRWAADSRMVGVSKSHSILPFEGQDLERYLRLPAGHRSSVYEPRTRTLAPVRAWALRLWPWEGKDLLHGLVRIEVALEHGSTERANAISQWILAERTPVSAPAHRWDRLLYGIYSVEQYLRSRRV
jgi:hypothetical protein